MHLLLSDSLDAVGTSICVFTHEFWHWSGCLHQQWRPKHTNDHSVAEGISLAQTIIPSVKARPIKLACGRISNLLYHGQQAKWSCQLQSDLLDCSVLASKLRLNPSFAQVRRKLLCRFLWRWSRVRNKREINCLWANISFNFWSSGPNLILSRLVYTWRMEADFFKR